MECIVALSNLPDHLLEKNNDQVKFWHSTKMVRSHLVRDVKCVKGRASEERGIEGRVVHIRCSLEMGELIVFGEIAYARRVY